MMIQPAVSMIKPSRVRYQVLAVGCSLAVLTYILRIGFSTGLPAIKKALDLDEKQGGYLIAAFLFAYAVFQVPGGLLDPSYTLPDGRSALRQTLDRIHAIIARSNPAVTP